MAKKVHRSAAREAAKRHEEPKLSEVAEAEIQELVGEMEATGSCRYADFSGNAQCESPVTKAYCDGKGGFWVENGRCG